MSESSVRVKSFSELYGQVVYTGRKTEYDTSEDVITCHACGTNFPVSSIFLLIRMERANSLQC